MALGPGIPVELPDLGPTPIGSIVDSLVKPPSEFVQDERWLAGIGWAPHVCTDGHLIDYNDFVTLDSLADQTGDAGKNGLAFETPYPISHGIRGSLRGFDKIDYVKRATDTLNRNQSKLIEAEFWDGAGAKLATNDYSGNFYLQGNGVDIATNLGDAAATAYKVQKGFAELERKTMSDLGGGQAMFHVTSNVITYLGNLQAIEVQGNRLVTKHGNIVVSGAGYSGSGPGANTVDTTRHSAWAYGTAVGYLWMSQVHVVSSEMPQVVDRTVDSVEVRASRFCSVTMDRCVCNAVKLDLQNS